MSADPERRSESELGPGIPLAIPEVMDESQACAILNISPTTARRYRARGELGHCKYGVRVLYTREHVHEFLKAHEIPVKAG